jgi:hypothetical protein
MNSIINDKDNINENNKVLPEINYKTESISIFDYSFLHCNVRNKNHMNVSDEIFINNKKIMTSFSGKSQFKNLMFNEEKNQFKIEFDLLNSN